LHEFPITFLCSRRPTDLSHEVAAAMRLVGADVSGWFRLLAAANCYSGSTSNYCRTEGRMARSVNTVLCEVVDFLEIATNYGLLIYPTKNEKVEDLW